MGLCRCVYFHFLINTGYYTAWRQTQGCDSIGEREPDSDKSCSTVINSDWSGYCECADGSKKMKKGCEIGEFATCNDACDREGK